MRYLGIDLAWSSNNFTALALMQNNTLIELVYLKSDEEIINYIQQSKPDKIGVDAPIEVKNETGNREVEKAFLKDFSRFKLGAYPVNQELFNRLYGGVRSEVLLEQIDYTPRENIFEVYPHATIIQCFTKSHVLPYKRKKGRSTTFIQEQLGIYKNYLAGVVNNLPLFEIAHAKGKKLKQIEDELDAITSAYTLYYCDNYEYMHYDSLLLVPAR